MRLRRVASARGLTADGGVTGLWGAILSGQGGSRRWVVPITSPNSRTKGDMAWFRVCQIRHGFAQLRQLEVLDLVMGVVDGTPQDRADLAALHAGIATVVEILRRSRRSPAVRQGGGITATAEPGPNAPRLV
jgi:hypothetical protein